MSKPRRALSVPSSDLTKKTLGIGDPTSADKSVGKQNARWASVDLTRAGGGGGAGDIREYDVVHDLGQIPTLCALESFENAANPATFITANEARRENWSASHCHVSIRLVSGTFDGCRAHFRVQGK